MGFVDLVGIATNYVKADFKLSDSVANLLPSMVFLWFLVFSVPTGMLMNKIGRRKTVLLSLGVTAAALLMPSLHYSFTWMMVSFCLLGIGNTLLQVSLNPLISNIVSGDKLASTLTFGQFIKAISSFCAPIIAAWAAVYFGSWKMLYPVFLAIAALTFISLFFEDIKDEKTTGKTSSFGECFALLGDGTILLCFIGIICHVGIDVGTNVSAPKILIDRLGISLAQAGYATSLYFLCRTVGAFCGSMILAKWDAKKFFAVSAAMLLLATLGLIFLQGKAALYICIALMGLGNANVFSIIFSQALLHKADKKNEVSGLMIMGVFGGALFPPVMGLASDAMGAQTGAIIVMGAGVIYLLFLALKMKAKA
jgi:fucose permease